jgi:8-oxo-dGTP pyrophosphatase MutT (NUDIX family)
LGFGREFNNLFIIKALMNKFAFPSKSIPISSSVIIVRRAQALQSTLKKQSDYEVLLLKRNPKISFGNFFAFPGGMVEKQDQIEAWKT